MCAVSLAPLVLLLCEGIAEVPSAAELFSDTRIASLLARSALLALFTSAAAVSIGGIGAFLLESRAFARRDVIRLLVLAPVVLPPFITVYGWRGVLKTLEGALGFEAGALSPSGRPAACVLLHALTLAPYAFIYLSLALRSLPAEWIDAGRLLLPPLGVIRRVIIPLAAPHLALVWAACFTLSFTGYETPYLLEVPTFAVEMTLAQAADRPGRAFIFALPAACALVALISASESFARARGFALTGRERWALGGTRRPGLCAWALLALWWGGTVIVPLAAAAGALDSLSRLAAAFRTSGEHLVWGSLLPVGAGIAASLAAYPLARGRKPARGAVLLWITVALPGALYAYGLIRVWNRPVLGALYDSPLFLVLGGAARWFPLAFFVIRAYQRSLPEAYFDAARFLDGGLALRARTRFRIMAPLETPGIAAAAALVFLLLQGDLAFLLQLQHPAAAPALVRIYSLLHLYREEEVAALALLHLAGVALTLSVLLSPIAWLERRRRGALKTRSRRGP